MQIKRLIWPSSRLLRVAVIVVVALLLYTLLGFFLAPRVIQNVAESRLSEALDRRVGIERVHFNPYVLSCEIKGLRIEQKSGDRSWIEAESLLVNLQAASLFKRALILSRLQIDAPGIRVTRRADLTYNFSDLLDREADPVREEEKEPLRFSVNNIQISSAEVVLLDQPARTRHRVSDLNISLPTISNFPYDAQTFVEPSLSGRINNMSFDLGGQAKPFAESRQSRFEVDVQDLELSHYLGYLPGNRNFNLERGRLSTDITVSYALPEGKVPYLSLEGGAFLKELLITPRGESDRELCALPLLQIEFGGGNLLTGDLRVSRVKIDEPRLQLTRQEDGTLFLPGLRRKPGSKEKEQADSAKEEKEGFFSLGLDSLKLSSGSIRFVDRSTTSTFSTTLSPVRLSLKDLRTDSDEPSRFALRMQTEENEVLSVNGSLGLGPTRFRARTRLSDILLSRWSAYYQPYFQGELQSGTFHLATDISLRWREQDGMRLQGLRLDLEDLRLGDSQGEQVLSLPEMSLRRGRLLTRERKFSAGSLRLGGARVSVRRGENGSLNLTDMLASQSKQQAPERESGEQAEQGSWSLGLEELLVKNSSAHYRQETTSSRMEMAASDISCRVQNLSNAPGEEAVLNASLSVGEEGSLQASGGFNLSPLKADLDLGLKGIGLEPFSPLVREYANLALQSGRLDVQGRLQLQEPEGKDASSLSFRGDASVRDMGTSEAGRETDFVAWRGLWLRDMEFASAPPSMDVAEIELTGLDGRMAIDPDGESNIKRIFSRQGPPEEDGNQDRAEGPGTRISIGKLNIADSRLDFIDHRVSPALGIGLGELQLSLRGFSTRQADPADIDLQANLAANAPFRLQGRMDLLGERFFADMDLGIENLELSPFSGYAGKYIGYAIGKGKLYLDSNIRIDGQELNSQHSLVLDQFTLGEEVKSPQAVNAPVKLGIALLKNRAGEIRIDKAVGGDLGDPEFSVGDLVMRVFVNVLVKAAQSPFAILGAMFDWSGEDISRIPFAPGQSSLEEAAREKLRVLGKALYERPQLKVDILGRADTSRDRQALREEKFKRLLREQKYREMDQESRSETKIGQMRISDEEYERYLWQAYKNASLEKPENFLGQTKRLPPQEMEERLRETVSVSQRELRQLAQERAAKILDFLRESGPVDPERLFRQNPDLGTGEDKAFTRAKVRIH